MRKALELKMNKLKDDKLSISMKEAMVRNVAAENKMKASVGAMNFEQQKNLQSMEHYKNKYAKRQRELQNEKQRMLNSRLSDDGKDQRKISAPACMVTVVEYKDVSDSGYVTQLQHRPQSTRPRSISVPNDDAGTLPSLPRGENGRKSTEPTSTKNESLTLPTIWPNENNQGPRRRLSTTSSVVPASTDFMAQTVTISEARSAPNSPCAPRRKMMQSLSPRGRSKSPARIFNGMDSLSFDSVRERLMADVNIAIANTKQFGSEQQPSEVTADFDQQDMKTSSASFKKIKDNSKTRKISCPGTNLFPSHPLNQPSNGDNDTTLEKNLNKIRFCQYLRSPSLPEHDQGERLPAELIPKAIIGGHTQWVPGD